MATKMSDPRELFLHELGDLLYAEKTLIKALPKLAQEATDEELRAASSRTSRRPSSSRQPREAFEAIGEKPKAEKCPAIDGIKSEHDEFMKEESPSPEVGDLSSPARAPAPSTTRSRPTTASSPWPRPWASPMSSRYCRRTSSRSRQRWPSLRRPPRASHARTLSRKTEARAAHHRGPAAPCNRMLVDRARRRHRRLQGGTRLDR